MTDENLAGRSPVRWVDSHAHLTMFGEDEVPALLERAAAAGVAGVMVPATNGEDLDLAIELARQWPQMVVAAVGVHPHDGASLGASMKRRLTAAVELSEVVAVGEIGLDYHYMNSPREDQLAALSWQLDLARDAGLPVVLHNRESWADLWSLLSARGAGLAGVCHSFTEGPAEARLVAEMGLLVGISGMVTFSRGDNIRGMAASLSLDEVLVETDSPFLAPVPHRGQRNEPAFVVEVGKTLASQWQVEIAAVAAATTRNFGAVFKALGSASGPY